MNSCLGGYNLAILKVMCLFMYLFIHALIRLYVLLYRIQIYKKQIKFNGESRSIPLNVSNCNVFGLLEFLRNLVLKCPITIFRYFSLNLDKAQEAGRQLLTSRARLRSQTNLCGIREGKLPLRQIFLRVLRWSAVGIFPPFGPYISVIWHIVVTQSQQVTASLNNTTVCLSVCLTRQLIFVMSVHHT